MAPDSRITGNDQTPRESRGGSCVRYRVLAFTVALAGITYLDRVCIAQTAQDLMRGPILEQSADGICFQCVHNCLRDFLRFPPAPGAIASGRGCY